MNRLSADAAIAKLLAELQWMRDEVEPGFGARSQRHRLIRALYKIEEFLDEQGASGEVLGDLLDLSIAIDDLDRGTISPLLQVQREGRAPDPSPVWTARAFLAAAVCKLEETMSLEKALDMVEADYGFLAAALCPTADKLRGAAKKWRRDFKEKTCKNKLAQKMFDEAPGSAEELLQDTVRQSLAIVAADTDLDRISEFNAAAKRAPKYPT